MRLVGLLVLVIGIVGAMKLIIRKVEFDGDMRPVIVDAGGHANKAVITYDRVTGNIVCYELPASNK